MFSAWLPAPISFTGYSQSPASVGFVGVIQVVSSAPAAIFMWLCFASAFPSTSSAWGPWPMSPHRLISDSVFPQLHCGPSALGLLRAPSSLQIILGRSSLHRASPFLLFPHCSGLLHHCPIQPSPCLHPASWVSSSALSFRAVNVTLIRWPLCSASSYKHLGSTSVSWSPGSAQPFSQKLLPAAPPWCLSPLTPPYTCPSPSLQPLQKLPPSLHSCGGRAGLPGGGTTVTALDSVLVIFCSVFL